MRVCAPVGSAGGVGVRVLELGVLGPVRAVRDGRELRLGGPKPRAVLALLLADPGRVVPAEYLAEMLWRGAAPPGAYQGCTRSAARRRNRLAAGTH